MTTPETLRELAEQWKWKVYPSMHEKLSAAAAAWEAKEREAEANRIEVMRLGKVNDDYQRRLEAAERKPKHRMVIVWDGKKWHSRRLACSVQDDIAGEMVYHCDKPLVNDADSVLAAIAGEEKP